MNRNLTEVIIPFATLAERVGGAALRRQVERRASAFAAAFHCALLDAFGLTRGGILATGTPYGDLARVGRRDISREDRNGAAWRLARGLPPGLKHTVARRELNLMARDRNVSPEELLRTLLFPEGILLAVAAQNQPQRVRLGPTWIKNKDGTVAVVRPTELRFGDYARWVLQEARRNAVEVLLDGTPESPMQTQPLSAREADTPKTPNALDALVAAERATEAASIVETLYRMASLRERELLTLLHSGTDPADLPAQMGLNPSTIRVLRHRLKEKLASL